MKMPFIIAGLGNPGEEYRKSRHSVGRFFVDKLFEKFSRDDASLLWNNDFKSKSLTAETAINKSKIILIKPDNFMNRSGVSLKTFIKSAEIAEKYLIVIYDDLDLPMGSFKISFNKSAGGHKGIESVIKSIKSKKFVRIRIGISPVSAGGKLKKPKGEKAVLDFILKNFSPKETDILNHQSKKIIEALLMIIEEGRDKAMSLFN